MPKLTAKEKCFHAYLKLLEEKDYTDITISDVTNAADISRPTFYRTFGSFANLEEYASASIYERISGNILPRFASDTETMWRMTINRMFSKLKDGTSIISKLKPHNFGHVSELVGRKFEKDLFTNSSISEKYDPICNISILFSVAAVWMRNGFKEDINEIADYLVKKIVG